MDIKISVPNEAMRSLEKVLAETLALKGKDPAKIVNKAAQYLTSFAISKIPRADPAKIRASLAQAPRAGNLFKEPPPRYGKTGKLLKPKKKTKARMEWEGTIAAVKLASLAKRSTKEGRRWRKALDSVADSANGGAGFYRVVARYVKSRMGTSGYMKSGLIPALKAFKARTSDTGLRRFKYPPGSATAANNSTQRITAAFEDIANGITDVAPRAIEDSIPEVTRLFKQWLIQDLNKPPRTSN